MRDDHLESYKRLQHIDKAIQNIHTYTATETMESFCRKDIVHDAVLFQFTIIGEAINHIESSKLEKYDYSWYKVRSFRNLIAHEYFNIKLVAVWQVIRNDLPALKKVIQQMLKTEF